MGWNFKFFGEKNFMKPLFCPHFPEYYPELIKKNLGELSKDSVMILKFQSRVR